MLNLSNRVTLRHLQGFVSLANLRSFSKAADQLAVTQPALSASIKQLENQLGAKLFDRTTHQVELTEQGVLVLAHAKYLLNTANNTFDDIQQAISSGKTRIRIGTMPSAMTFTAAAVARYTKVHGDQVEVVLSDMSSDALLLALGTGELDFCICTKLAHSDLFESVTVLEDELVLVVSQQHPLAKMGEVPWRLLAGEEILLFNKGSIWDLASMAMRQHGLAPTKLCQVVHSESLYGIVRAQIAVGIMCSLYTTSLTDSALHVAQLRAPTLKREIVLMRRNEAVRNSWTDHCFTELNKDLKQVNRWF
ncbi:LysR substrate-binding domain-containing protein [Rhodoferax sp.]|uniref:LysR family transcriptional regulator n=1 Tax=Rhodoferax sp. TaxID=50421 RepID=UPI00374D361F